MRRMRSVVLFVSLAVLVPSTGLAVTVSTVNELANAVASANAGGDKQITVAAGLYSLNGVYLRITAGGVTVAGATGRSDDVILDGNYETTEIFQVLGSNITLRDMTLKRAYYHPIHIFPENSDVTGILISNIHIIDPGQQAVKINQNEAKTYSVNFGRITQSIIELTDSGRDKVWEINGSCYTGGVDGHHAKGWRVDGNVIKGFWCADGLAEHGVHFWSSSEDTLVEKNRIVNCDRGVGFGLGSSGHLGGIIRNNFISHDSGHSYSDVGIGLESASGVQVYNNTIYHQHSYPNAIEYRFAATRDCAISNNLTNRSIASRDGGTATVSNNITTAQQNWLQNALVGDLHLAAAVAGVVDSGISVSGLLDDIDGEQRPMGRGIDIGADELISAGSTGVPALTWLQLLL